MLEYIKKNADTIKGVLDIANIIVVAITNDKQDDIDLAIAKGISLIRSTLVKKGV